MMPHSTSKYPAPPSFAPAPISTYASRKGVRTHLPDGDHDHLHAAAIRLHLACARKEAQEVCGYGSVMPTRLPRLLLLCPI